MNVAEPMKARVMGIMNKIFKWVIKYIHHPHFYFLVTINIHTTSNYSHIYTQVIREAAPNCFKDLWHSEKDNHVSLVIFPQQLEPWEVMALFYDHYIGAPLRLKTVVDRDLNDGMDR